MTPHDVCIHAEEWGTVRQQIRNLEKCTEKLKTDQEEAEERIAILEKIQVTKDDFNDFKKSIQVVGFWTVVSLFVAQLFLGLLNKYGVI